MKIHHRAPPLNRQQPPRARRNLIFSGEKFRTAGVRLRPPFARQVIADGVRQNEVAIGQSLHQGARAQTIRAVIGEVGFAQNEQARQVAHQVVIHPQAAHRVMHRRVDAHRHSVGVLAGDALVHLEEIAVALADDFFAEPLDGIAEVQIDAAPAGADAAPFVADLLDGARSNIARREVAVARILALKEIIAVFFRNLVGRAIVAALLRHPDAPVVAQRLAHQRQLRLIVAAHRNAGRVYLRVAGIGKVSAALVCAISRRDVAALRIGR